MTLTLYFQQDREMRARKRAADRGESMFVDGSSSNVGEDENKVSKEFLEDGNAEVKERGTSRVSFLDVKDGASTSVEKIDSPTEGTVLSEQAEIKIEDCEIIDTVGGPLKRSPHNKEVCDCRRPFVFIPTVYNVYCIYFYKYTCVYILPIWQRHTISTK